jgi:hypothetical protein
MPHDPLDDFGGFFVRLIVNRSYLAAELVLPVLVRDLVKKVGRLLTVIMGRFCAVLICASIGSH